MREIGFGIIGTGVIADFHARALAAATGARLVGVYDRIPERAEAFAQRYGTVAAKTMEEFFALHDLEAVSVTTPSGNHAEAAIAALDAGKHVLCEKPLEVNLEKVDAMLEAARRNGRHLAAVLQMRLSADARRLKSAIEKGRFGRMTLCSAYIKWWRSQEYYDQGAWRGTKLIDGGGALFNQGIHTIDLLQWFAGMPAEVQACMGTLAHERIEVEDTAVAILKFPSGAMGVIEGATSVWPGFLSRIEISGDRGSAVFENERLIFWKFADESAEDLEVLAGGKNEEQGSGSSDPKAIGVEGHRLQVEDLARAIREGVEPAILGADARNSVQLIHAIYESAEKKTAVTIR